MADTTDLKSVGASREGSSPSFAINYDNKTKPLAKRGCHPYTETSQVGSII